MAIITNETLLNISKEIEAENVVLDAIAKQESWKHKVRDWSVVQEIVQKGLANSVFSVGDQLMTTYTYGGVEYECPFDIVDIGTSVVKNEDGEEVEKPSITLQMHYLAPQDIQFDATEREVATEVTALANTYYYGTNDNSTFALLSYNEGDTIGYSAYTYIYHNSVKDTSFNILKYGYNRYSKSAVRQWLNSNAGAGQWWTSQHTGDVAPSQRSLAGFMTAFPSDFLNVLAKPKTICVANNTTDSGAVDIVYDAFFLPSLMNMHINPQASSEGTDWAYYQKLQTAKFNQYGTYEILKRYRLDAKTSSATFWMRSANVGNSCSAWIVASSGNVNGSSGAYNSYRVSPACVIC